MHTFESISLAISCLPTRHWFELIGRSILWREDRIGSGRFSLARTAQFVVACLLRWEKGVHCEFWHLCSCISSKLFRPRQSSLLFEPCTKAVAWCPAMVPTTGLSCFSSGFLVTENDVDGTSRNSTARELFACAGQASVVVAGQRQNAVTDVRKNLCR